MSAARRGSGRPLLPAAETGAPARGAHLRSGWLMGVLPAGDWRCVWAARSVRPPPNREQCRASARSSALNREPEPRLGRPLRPALALRAPRARPVPPRAGASRCAPFRRPNAPFRRPNSPVPLPGARPAPHAPSAQPGVPRPAVGSPPLSLAVPYFFFSCHLKKMPSDTPSLRPASPSCIIGCSL